MCVCVCTMGISFADTGEGSCAGRQELKGLQEKAGWGVLLGDGDSSVWQSGIFIFGADHTEWYLTVKQGRNLFSLLTFISEGSVLCSSVAAHLKHKSNVCVVFSPAGGWVFAISKKFFFCCFLFPCSLRIPLSLFRGGHPHTPLLPLWPVVSCFFRHCELAVGFSGFGIIKHTLPGLVLSCFAACASCYTPVPARSPPSPSWLHLHPVTDRDCVMAQGELPWNTWPELSLVCCQGWSCRRN